MSSADRTPVELPLAELLAELRARIGNPRNGLPTEVFFFLSELTPMVNVDLLIKNAAGQTLLTWRQDEFYGPGWHVPGGVVRFKENLETRIQLVAKAELGARVRFAPTPILIREAMAPHRDVRGHFISLLYSCALESPPDPALGHVAGELRDGQWQWHDRCPQNVIPQHEGYRPYVDQTPPLVGEA